MDDANASPSGCLPHNPPQIYKSPQRCLLRSNLTLHTFERRLAKSLITIVGSDPAQSDLRNNCWG